MVRIYDQFTDASVQLIGRLALAGHAWVGMWTVFTDYITTGKLGSSAAGLRLVLQSLMIIAILVFLFWGIMIFWGNGFGVVAV